MALTSDQIINISNQIITEFELNKEDDKKNIQQILKMHGNNQFYLLRYVSFCKNLLILSKAAKYTIEIPSRKEQYFLNKLTDSCFIQIKNRRVEKAELRSEYCDEVFLTIDVFK